ncbi:hypothetical protein [Thauera sp.]|jgi:hypothetical protein|uniref:hypothetical protein n=1 Tax=Thauera sp. TaxID=1905334 RepID=UPI002622A341|nr:hypothetical protein [Thauera sp.]
MSLHTELLDYVEREHAGALLTPAQLSQDALTLVLKNGVVLTVRYAAADAYSLRWRTSLHADGVELGIDTAPTHPQLATTPNHLHRADGSVVADPLTRIGRSPQENLARMLEALSRDPQLTDCTL